jgi:hypothetical protein
MTQSFYQRWRCIISILFLIVSWLPIAQAATDCTQVTDMPQAECGALLDLYHSTDGPNWRTNTGWNVTNTPCSWYGVSCADGHVTRLNLYYNLLSGSIPESLGNLSNLQFLYLHRNQLSGSIPESLGNLT